MTNVLDKVIREITGIAKERLLTDGSLQPTVFGVRADGTFTCYGLSFSDAKEKKNALMATGMYMIRDGVIGYIVAMESWVRMASGEEEIDGEVSKHPDKQEALTILFCKRDPLSEEGLYKQMDSYLFFRFPNGKISSFDHADSKFSSLAGDFFGLLAPKNPPQEVLEIMKQTMSHSLWANFAKGVERIEM